MASDQPPAGPELCPKTPLKAEGDIPSPWGWLWLALASSTGPLAFQYFGPASLLLVPVLLIILIIVAASYGWKTFASTMAVIGGIVALIALAVVLYDWRVYFPKHDGSPPLTVAYVSTSRPPPGVTVLNDKVVYRVDNGSDEEVDCYRVEHHRDGQVHKTYSLDKIPPKQSATLTLIGGYEAVPSIRRNEYRSRDLGHAWQDGDRLVFLCRDYAMPFEYGGRGHPQYQTKMRR